MLPPIFLVSSVEMIRDGGSLAAIFEGTNSACYWLFLEIDVEALQSGEWLRERYLSPVIVEHQVRTSIEVSWQHARIFLNQMRPLLREPEHQRMLEVMIAVVDAEGKMSYESVVDLVNANDDFNVIHS